MTINFKEEVLKRKDDLIKDLQALLKIKSELTTFDPNRIGAPFGEGNKEALDWFLALAKKDGFKVENVDGYAGHIEYGEGNEYVGSIGHLDVVPAGNDWTYPPYGAEIHDGKLYARGSEDDKGPTVAVYYALKILKELNVPLSKRVKIILGIDEESGWRCVKHYFKKYPEAPVAGFIPDADFPLIYGEKGITRTVIKGAINDSRILEITGGFRDNMVPDYALVKLSDVSFKDGWLTYLADNELKGDAVLEDGILTLSVTGISAHGSLPHLGKNAIDYLFKGLKIIGLSNKLITFVNEYLVDDYLGKKLAVNYKDAEMGDLTNNFGVIKTEGSDFVINLNLRYPNGVDYQKDVFEKIEALVKPLGYVLSVEHHQKLLYKDPQSALIQTLLKVYRKHTHDDSEPITIGGGTFARATDNVVAFGPHFLSKPSFIHQRDEFIEIDDLITATIIYTEALYELAK